MTQIDFDNDGTNDGIINLFDEYNSIAGVTPITSSDGQWYDPNFNYALNETNGNLHLWDLSNASETESDYHFQFINTNSACTDGILIDMNVVIGPFSGFSVPTIGNNDVNIEICDSPELFTRCNIAIYFDLFQTLLSTPSAHSNGTWTYLGNSPNFIGIDEGRYLIADIPYQAGPPLIDDEVFEFKYTVPGMTPCAATMETTVKVSVVRSGFSGFANKIDICEEELIAGNFNMDINLRDDAYLVNEDIEGTWSSDMDPTNQISTPNDSQVNLAEVYNDLILTNPRFRCSSYYFKYSVDSRSNVCFDYDSTVRFTFFESFRPFEQEAPENICVADHPLSLNLYDLITFSEENGVLYDYPNRKYTNWKLVSGPSNLGLVSNTGLLETVLEDPDYTSLGTIDLSNITNDDVGTYVFEYIVDEEYNCKMHPYVGSSLFNGEITYDVPDGCSYDDFTSPPCGGQTAQITLNIHPYNYPGENTSGLELCQADVNNPLDLISLLNDNGIDTIYTGSEAFWLNLDTNEVIDNPFTIPDFEDEINFNLQYNITANDCFETADLSFTLYEQYKAGSDNSITVCIDDDEFELFDMLNGNPNENGTWSGPNNFTSTNHLVTFNPETFSEGNYIYTVPSNGICNEQVATVEVIIAPLAIAGDNVEEQVCILEGSIDLLSLLDSNADAGGTFIDTDNTNALNGSVVDLGLLNAEIYHFQYQVQPNTVCEMASSEILLEVISVPAPIANNQSFCIGYGATIADLEVQSNLSDFNWYDNIDDTMPIDETETLTDNEDYYVAAVADSGCESERTKIAVTLIQFGEQGCEPCISDGVTPNNDGENDTLSLCDLPNVYPNFDLKIFNRYGNTIYTADANTPLFEGVSNVKLTLGDQVPAGVYFYIFNPNDGLTKPIQGDFYLSR